MILFLFFSTIWFELLSGRVSSPFLASSSSHLIPHLQGQMAPWSYTGRWLLPTTSATAQDKGLLLNLENWKIAAHSLQVVLYFISVTAEDQQCLLTFPSLNSVSIKQLQGNKFVALLICLQICCGFLLWPKNKAFHKMPIFCLDACSYFLWWLLIHLFTSALWDWRQTRILVLAGKAEDYSPVGTLIMGLETYFQNCDEWFCAEFKLKFQLILVEREERKRMTLKLIKRVTPKKNLPDFLCHLRIFLINFYNSI